MANDTYKSIEAKRGREFILRVPHGSDVYAAVQRFAVENDIKFAQVHTAFMGNFRPARYMVWVPDPRDPENFDIEDCVEVQNQTMILSMSGFIHQRIGKDGKMESFPAIHYITGAAWNAPVGGGHLAPGTIVKGNLELFVTELLGIEADIEDKWKNSAAPECWYKNTDL